ncbi:Gfo/Idh/MocA family protein [Gulosibacter chungangensis]|uniref:Gfo/Idh/MocA family oxidoreductase n=1 Tax=Gulosibacter chungangensis TaxID=979746 RepID=A0A7J5B9U8_9MICO|nr:Gfo/Idh/MocA family oxidoreductase [Gulosibacter chungangensis]KAB1642583.1 Gfo/Idh/MocA family oxidoreductase [Gulosibacter chungangensis]
MSTKSIGVAVIGAGMAGKAHAAAYRSASAVFDSTLPEIRLVSIADVYEPLAEATAKRYGFERHDTTWQALAEAEDIDVVSVVVANRLHREIVEGLLAAGKHVLCEKPLSDTLEDAEAMVAAANNADTIARVGLTYLRQPGIAYAKQLIESGRLGQIYHVSGRYHTEYAADPQAPMVWRYKGPAGSGALADVASHLSYIIEALGGEVESVSGGTLTTVIKSRPKPIGNVVGHERGAVSEEREPVENDDYAAFSVQFANGTAGTFEASRVALGHPNGLSFEVYGEKGSLKYDFERPSEISVFLADDDLANAGFRTVILGPSHPYWKDGLAMDAPGVGIGQNDGFVYQARAFLEEVAGIPESESLPRVPSLAYGLRNMQLLDAVAQSAAQNGAAVKIGK